MLSNPKLDPDLPSANPHIDLFIGLPAPYRAGAARLFFDAFQRKLIPLMGVGNDAVEAISVDLDAERCIVAISEDRVVGIAGLSYEGRRFANFRRRTFTRRFGLFAGFFRYLAYAAFNIPDLPNEIIIDGIAVEESRRGRGIGTKLLKAVFEYAGRNGMESIKLVVVDTNPDARRLYERLGFKATRTRTYPSFMARAAGFSHEITMMKEVGNPGS